MNLVLVDTLNMTRRAKQARVVTDSTPRSRAGVRAIAEAAFASPRRSEVWDRTAHLVSTGRSSATGRAAPGQVGVPPVKIARHRRTPRKTTRSTWPHFLAPYLLKCRNTEL